MGKRIAYVDCFSGASGDMLLGALLGAGLALHDLEEDIAQLHLGEVRLTLTPQVRQGIAGWKFDVVDEGRERPAHNLGAVRRIIEGSGLPPEVIAASVRVFTRLGEAEAAVHGTTVEEVHFHEVGAVDALVDIVGFCSGVRRLGLEALYASPLPTGMGRVRTEHGLLPVPAPATLALLAAAQAPLLPAPAAGAEWQQAQGELVTPTGAALLTTLAIFQQPPMVVQRVGYGFGSKEFPWPNLLRIWVGEAFAMPAPTSAPAHEQDHEHAHAHGEAHDHEHAHPQGEHDHEHAQGEEHDRDHDHEHTHPHDHAHEEAHAHPHEHEHPHHHDHPHQEGHSEHA
jgi:hypothetical protein